MLGPAHASNDSELEHAAKRLLEMDPQGVRTAAAIRRSFDMLLDGQHTGRFRWEQLHKTEKTHAGTLVEINLQREFAFPDGAKMDYAIDGIDVDCKYSQDLGKWMIPPEAMDHLCLGLWANDQAGRWSAGLFRVTEDALTAGGNRDRKRSLTKAALTTAVKWLHLNAKLPENALLRLAQDDIDAIFAGASGNERVSELFRRAQRKPISRAVIATVAQQEDYMKRVRDNGGARGALRQEGIVIFGQYLAHGALAIQLGLPMPGPGESVSVRLTPATDRHAGEPHIHLDGQVWVTAHSNDPVVEAPVLPKPKKGIDVG